MTYYATCRHCQKSDGCPIKAEIADKIRGIGITTFKHRCAERVPLFKRHDPIVARLQSFGDEFGNSYAGDFPGWFVGLYKETKPLIYIPVGTRDSTSNVEFEQANGKGFCRVAWSRLLPRETSDASPLCDKCDGINGQCRDMIAEGQARCDCPHLSAEELERNRRVWDGAPQWGAA